MTATPVVVSIRARHCWRAMPAAPPPPPSAAACFNPRPPLLAGDAARQVFEVRGVRVSIRARHCWRAMPDPLPDSSVLVIVSIRARHCWRAMPCLAAASYWGPRCFNPRPPLLAGDAAQLAAALPGIIVSIRARHCWRAMLEPPPPPPAPAPVSIRARHCWRAMPSLRAWRRSKPRVSIRARHCWRAMLANMPTSGPRAACFNPRPPLLAGDARQPGRERAVDVGVSIRARHCWRAMPRHRRLPAEPQRFNPRPPLLAGDAGASPVDGLPDVVSIRARHCWRAMPNDAGSDER